MNSILVFAIIALVSRNAFYMGFFSETMRGFALVLLGLSGMFFVFKSNLVNIFKRYWLIHSYVFAMLLSTIFSDNYAYIFFQNASMIVVYAYAIAYYENIKSDTYSANEVFFKTVMYLYVIVCLISLVLAHFSHATAYEVLWGGEVRFRGVFAKSGMMGATAGVLVGVAAFSKTNKIIKYVAILSGGICLALTLSRTFWLAALFSYAVTYWLYRPKAKFLMYFSFFLIALVFLISSTFEVNLDLKSAEKVTRANSITNLSGRLELWKEGIDASSKRPFLGYGLTAGSAALSGGTVGFGKNDSLDDTRERGRRTFHSGYIQALLDNGLIGLLAYMGIIVFSVINIIRFDKDRKYSREFYCVLFLLISNFSENVIYAVTVFNSTMFWFLAIFSMRLKSLSKSFYRNGDAVF